MPGHFGRIPQQIQGCIAYFSSGAWKASTAGTSKQVLAWSTGTPPIPGPVTLDPTFLSNPYKFRVHRSAAAGAQVVATGTTTVLQFDAKVAPSFDTNGNFDAVTNFRYTVPVAGFYQFNAGVDFTTNTDAGGTVYMLSLFKNGVELTTYDRIGMEVLQTNNAVLNLVGGSFEQLAVNDLIDIRVLQSSGGNRSFNARPITGCVFSGFLVAAT